VGRHPVSAHIHALLAEENGASTDRSARSSIEPR
jgi:hypothetical protein